MQRDMDLVRQILLAAESKPHGFGRTELAIDGYTDEQIGYHVYLLGQAGLVESIDRTNISRKSPYASIKTVTWIGHEFLASARSPKAWSQAKDLMHKAGGGSFQVWQSVLTQLVKQSLGLG
ncbi:hypothetical protein HDC36_003665 [Xanthomonas sp. JAI131]|uniref:DUF2513 domain-containing protein n=1 Tax=Xanthomonas sp. JAI131 TaxID=2723067 RepID=UPI0015CD7967|nr:DUF2513 domain-containing protein [Xanthomonas sp. JAI131]NYF22189.1 hypothetical protein [Xanthomonas sp. JAI131]